MNIPPLALDGLKATPAWVVAPPLDNPVPKLKGALDVKVEVARVEGAASDKEDGALFWEPRENVPWKTPVDTGAGPWNGGAAFLGSVANKIFYRLINNNNYMYNNIATTNRILTSQNLSVSQLLFASVFKGGPVQTFPYEISFIHMSTVVHLHVNKTTFHMKGFALQ